MDNNISYIENGRKKYRLNVGIILFGVAFVYIVLNIIIYVTSDHVTIYEVHTGSLYRDTSYTGFIKRNETIVNSDKDGYINYFAAEGSHVGLRTRVYASSNQEIQFDDIPSDDNTVFSDEELASLYAKVDDSITGFSDSKFDDIYTLKNSIEETINEKSSLSKTAQINSMIESGQEGLGVYNAPITGVISYNIDGYENIKLDDINAEIFDKASNDKVTLYNNNKVKSNDPVYKIITDDLWTVVIILDDETAKELEDRSSVSVNFSKDNVNAVAGLEIKKKDGVNLAYLSFNQGMVRYFKDRYIDIELVLQNVSGLKIPTSSIVKKAFYEVPEDYLTQGGNSNSTGVLVNSGDENPSFVSVNIYSKDEDKGVVYLDSATFKDIGDTLVKPDSNETYQLSSKKEIEGVYNINKGYAVFKKIEILSKSDDYYIIKEGSEYSLSNYDHIALDGTTIDENDVVF
ncbi:MAG: HlyD family efflux transporter periplasmic adaptor subunit [Suipraeoptans sp.]